MMTTLFYSLLALDQTVAELAAQYGPLALRASCSSSSSPRPGWWSSRSCPATRSCSSPARSSPRPDLNIHVLVVVLIVAAVLGDTVNYSVGHYIGPKVFDRPDSRWFKQAHLRRTQAFYDRYGGVTIIIGRFVPIIRTFAPFLAGVAGMTYRRFLVVQHRRRHRLDRLARVRGLPVRQHPVGQAQPVADRRRDRRSCRSFPAVDDVHQANGASARLRRPDAQPQPVRRVARAPRRVPM